MGAGGEDVGAVFEVVVVFFEDVDGEDEVTVFSDVVATDVVVVVVISDRDELVSSDVVEMVEVSTLLDEDSGPLMPVHDTKDMTIAMDNNINIAFFMVVPPLWFIFCDSIPQSGGRKSAEKV